MSNRTGYIYGLFDPRNGKLRYIGQTIQNPKRREWQHSNKREMTYNHRKANWTKQLLSQNYKPEMFILEEVTNCTHEVLNDLEQWYISYWRGMGCDLTNLSAGGGGAPAVPYTEEQKKKYSEAAKRTMQNASIERRRFLADAIKSGKIPHPRKGVKLSDELKEKMRATKLGKKASEETRAKLRELHKGTNNKIQTPVADSFGNIFRDAVTAAKFWNTTPTRIKYIIKFGGKLNKLITFYRTSLQDVH